MDELKIITDEHVPKAVVTQLQQLRIDVVRVEDTVGKGTSDEDILRYAADEGRSVLGFDDDFEKLNAAWSAQGLEHCGIFKCSSKLLGGKGIGTIVTEIAIYYQLIESEAGTLTEDIYNQIIYIP